MSVYFLPTKNTLKLLRVPFSVLLMPIFLLVISQVTQLNVNKTIWCFIIIHVLVYPASNGYNSYIDKDEDSIGGLEKPPMPTKNLFYITLLLDFLAVLFSVLFVEIKFALCIVLYILASRAYSSKQIRLKKYPIIGFLTVVFFQGAFTYYMVSVGISDIEFQFSETSLLVLLACSLQIAGAYPLTQIYQHQQDLKDGVTTISYKLGYKGTFIFTALMFGLCNVCYYLYFNAIDCLINFYILQLFFMPIVLFFSYWFIKVLQNLSAINFKNTMRMNLIAALCMNLCFIVFILLKK